jgi:hypothetical protein
VQGAKKEKEGREGRIEKEGEEVHNRTQKE